VTQLARQETTSSFLGLQQVILTRQIILDDSAARDAFDKAGQYKKESQCCYYCETPSIQSPRIEQATKIWPFKRGGRINFE